MALELGFHQLRPAGVMIEVPRDERDVDVAGLADRLPVVHRFEHSEEPCVALHRAGEGVEKPRAAMTA